MPLYLWSQTSGTNASSDPSINFAEGMAPSAVNDSARAMMAAIAKYRDDIAGSIVTSGTSTAYTVTTNSGFDTLAHLNGQVVAFTPHTTNGATVTLNVDSLGAKPLRTSPGVELQTGVLVQGTPYAAIYNNSDGAFYLYGVGASPGIPLAGGMDFWGTTTPSSAFAFPAGQAISRTTYAPLFALVGTTYGAGDGTTTFNLPDKRGRVTASLDNMGGSAASRLSSSYFPQATTLGGSGGLQSQTLQTANLPPYTPSGNVSTAIGLGGGLNTANAVQVTGANNVAVGGTSTGGALIALSGNLGATSTFTGISQGGTSTPVPTIQPTIVCNYIIRIV